MKSGHVWFLLVVAGCGSGRRVAPPPPPPVPTVPERTLAYGPPVAGSGLATYEFSDTVVSDIQGGAIGTIRVSIGVRGAAELRIVPSGNDLQVTANFKEFAGSFSNSAGGGVVSATAADIVGPLIITLTPRGVVTVTQQPQLSPAFRAVSGTEQTHRRFFLRLPGGPVPIGGTWTDTVQTEETNDGITSRVNNIIWSTYARDTTVAGRTMNIIISRIDRTLDIAGTSQGVDIVQKLRGSANSTAVWDPERKMLVWRNESANMTGTFDLPAMNMTNMPITATGRTTVRLRESAGALR